MNVETGSLTLVVALLFTAAGVGGIVHLFWRANGWPQTQGLVIASHRRLDTRFGNARYAHFPTIAFRAADGRDYEVQGDDGRSAAWTPGAPIALRYNPADPNQVTTLGAARRLMLPGLFILFAAVCWIAWYRE